jgi:hypothetical protein
VSVQRSESVEPQTQVSVRELRRLRALARLASPRELADADDAAQVEEHDELEAAGLTGSLSDEQARRLLGIPLSVGDEEYLTTEEARRRLGLPQ